MNTLTKAAVQGAACGLMIGAVLLVGGRVWRPVTVEAQSKQPAVADVVRARRFEVVDAAGKERAVLGVFSDDVTALRVYDATGKMMLMGLGVTRDDEAGLGLRDAAGKLRAGLNVTSDGSPLLLLLDAAEKARAGLRILPTGVPMLDLNDTAGEIRMSLSVSSDSGPVFRLFDAAGKMGAGLGMTPDGIPGLVLYDTAEHGRAGMVMTSDGPTLELRDAGRNLRAVLGTTSVKSEKPGEATSRPESSLMLFDKDGKVMWQAP